MVERTKNRCLWCGSDKEYVAYHDTVWGVPEYCPKQLFSKLILDGQQAGLSWITILKKQNNYLSSFHYLDPERIHAIQGEARQTYIEAQMNNPGIIRNRLKINSIFKNADAYMALEKEGVCFSEWLWSTVQGEPVQNNWEQQTDVPAYTEASEALSKRLKKQGFTFVGPTIVYAFMQAVGMVNDHVTTCFRHQAVQQSK
ncbi:DNA-3-methyladenine glycosylase I [Aliidiomarina taiwanensis]|uniref:DNA-3-methyladenine glycosylase I n=1 Tax=Aliidiomarina taiwanensis TaxID=946228 RepID=A0A432X8V5_9GAMM|nr:DNA-3-methyladenine glycosylase I [Aliidiomarina taiwanensis]RUO43681.1 DNA-3-methyladenine glycosylase I [Aliidiomarina taiwanensis]